MYVDGKKEGTARDNGMGGMIVIEPKQLLDKLTDAGLKMGKVKVDFTDELFDIDAEDIINQLLTEYLYKKDFKRVIKKSKVQYVVEGEIYELKVKPTSDKMRVEQVSIVKSKNKNALLFDDLSESEQFELYCKCVGHKLGWDLIDVTKTK